MDEITGGSPYGASTLAEDGNGGDRQPSANEVSAASIRAGTSRRLPWRWPWVVGNGIGSPTADRSHRPDQDADAQGS
jgi:hypothetical protein